jgi:hypothetical protein
MAKKFALSKAEEARLRGAIALLKPYVTSLSEVWPLMTDAQKRSYVEHSPLFASVIEIMQPYKDVM